MGRGGRVGRREGWEGGNYGGGIGLDEEEGVVEPFLARLVVGHPVVLQAVGLVLLHGNSSGWGFWVFWDWRLVELGVARVLALRRGSRCCCCVGFWEWAEEPEVGRKWWGWSMRSTALSGLAVIPPPPQTEAYKRKLAARL